MKVMVTGAGGMLADAVAAHLAARGDASFGVFFSPVEAESAAARYPRGVVFELGRSESGGDLGPLADAAAAFAPDWIFHLAAWTDVDGCEADPERAQRGNALACREVAGVAKRCGARVLAVSTDYVFAGDGTRPYREDDPTGPRSVYGRTKLAGEDFVRESGVPHAIARTSWLYGPHGRNFVDTIRARLAQDLPARVVDDQRGCPTSTPDLAAALATIAEREGRGTFHVAGSGETTWCGLARAIGESMGKASLVSAMTTEELGRPAPRPRYSVLDTSRYAALAGAPLPDWRDALARHLAGARN